MSGMGLAVGAAARYGHALHNHNRQEENPMREDPHSGSLNPGTGGVRDTYKPNLGSTSSQAEYAAQTEAEVRAGKKPLLTRIWVAVRRSIWGE